MMHFKIFKQCMKPHGWLNGMCGGQPKDITFVFAASPVNYIIKSNSKDWLTRNQDNVYEWRDLSICGLLF
jgi:hypothetical protein